MKLFEQLSKRAPDDIVEFNGVLCEFREMTLENGTWVASYEPLEIPSMFEQLMGAEWVPVEDYKPLVVTGEMTRYDGIRFLMT